MSGHPFLFLQILSNILEEGPPQATQPILQAHWRDGILQGKWPFRFLAFYTNGGKKYQYDGNDNSNDNEGAEATKMPFLGLGGQ